ncbi:uncharacterized protein BDW47DRAFT_105500 [Aspergillus candidus]|uniref:Uncharacterized protein n=1 Tax=Aspergillus candidus TaxID=41067 RepID=A0A2I2FC52_ASPCN|nr:hypothetical protein BDW47DRAFT_105500 [Aspergillus candidus]PLB38208.1 hypothetical protein BDW47DRAFT_105500 [Aspergillus candidus]
MGVGRPDLTCPGRKHPVGTVQVTLGLVRVPGFGGFTGLISPVVVCFFLMGPVVSARGSSPHGLDGWAGLD